MKQETIHRIKTAGEYQKKALMALFPERTREHLDVIEQELKMMALELVAELMTDCGKKDAGGGETKASGESGVKKVDIA